MSVKNNNKICVLILFVISWLIILHLSLFISRNIYLNNNDLFQSHSFSIQSSSVLTSYKCSVEKVIDGDTIDVVVDLGLGILKKERIRLNNINTPELRSSNENERVMGNKAKDFVNEELKNAKDIILITRGARGKYGRLIADLSYDGKILSKEIIKMKLGEKYE